MRHAADYLDILKGNIVARGQHVDVTPEHNDLDAQLEAPLEALDLRPRRMLAPSVSRDQNFNQVYNTIMSNDMIDRIADYTVLSSGVITNGVQTLFPIVMPANAKAIAVRKWPDAPFFFLMIRQFSIMPTTAGAAGDLQCSYIDTAGNIVPLGDINAASGQTLTPTVICPAPITDSGVQSLGTLSVNWIGGTAPITVGYSLGFSVIFLLPAKHQYEDTKGHEQSSSYLD